MEDLTSLEGKIDDDTRVIINGQEVLSKDGISGMIRETGVGFGTGRHTSGRRGELPVIVYEVRREKSPVSKPKPVMQSQRLMIDAACSATQMPVHDMGIDAMTASDRPQLASVGASAADFGPHIEIASVAVSAMPEYQNEVRSCGNQVSEGRFDPRRFESAIQTERYLLDLYLAKNTTTGEIQTDPIDFAIISPKGNMMCQTEMLPVEDYVREPIPQEFPEEPQPYAEEQMNSRGDLMEDHAPQA